VDTIDSNDEKDVSVCPNCGTEITPLNEDESAALAAAIRNGESESTFKCKGCGTTISLVGLDNIKRDVDDLIGDFGKSISKKFDFEIKF
jgi:predicted RNA-binding Zn-ribbon protein involved in translation (DUF1610 family)